MKQDAIPELWEPGRVEEAVAAAVQAARDVAGSLELTDAGMAALAVELGRAVDTASRGLDVRGVAAASRELREVCARLGLDPSARGTAGDAFTDLLAELQRPDSRGPLGHGPKP